MAMRFVSPDEILTEDVQRTFRHSPLGALILCVVLCAPIAALFLGREGVADAARALPWPAWLVVAPLGLLMGTILWLCVSASLWVFRAALKPTNWLVKTTREGLYVHLRSFQNHHFPSDVPTAVFLPYGAIARARRVDESYAAGSRDERTRARKRWLELELRGVDTAPLAAWLAAERARPAPSTRTLGVRSATRFHHAPVVVPRPGCVYVEWMGRALLQAIADHVDAAEPRELALDAPGARSLEARVDELIARGDSFAAVDLVREERSLSLTEAHALVRGRRRGEHAVPQR
jgi:hypothetical protein